MMILEALSMRPDKHDMQRDHCGGDNDIKKQSLLIKSECLL